MKLIIFLIVAFLVLVYIYTFIKNHKKRKQRSVNTVTEFNRKYRPEKKALNNNTDKDANYRKYVTKYNSKMDYITKDELNG